MKTVWTTLLALIIAVSLAGCKQQSVSRTYHANMDSTWNAVVAVAAKVSKDAPKLDKEGRKITTGLVYSDIHEESDTNRNYPATVRSVEVWRGLISLSPEYGGTKVTIKVQKANSATSGDLPINDRKDVTVGITISSTDTSWQNNLLDEIQTELASKGK